MRYVLKVYSLASSRCGLDSDREGLWIDQLGSFQHEFI